MGITHIDEDETTPLVITERLLFGKVRQKIADQETAYDQLAMQIKESNGNSDDAILKTKLEMIRGQIERMREMIIEHKSDRHGIGTAWMLKQYKTAREDYQDARTILQQLKLKAIELQSFSITSKTLTVHGWEYQ